MLNKPTRWSFIPPDSDENFPAEPLGDVATKNNTLSFYEVDETKDSTNDVIVGMTTNREYIDKIDYVKIPVKEFRDVKLQIEKNHGITPCEKANALHVDAVKVKANQLLKLAKIIYYSMPESVNRLSESEVKKLIASADKEGKVNRDQLQFSEETKRKIGIL